MEVLYTLGQALFVAVLAAGAWFCFVNAGRYDAESLAADQRASREARARAHSVPQAPPAGAEERYSPLRRAA